MWSFDSFYDDFAVSALCGGAPSFVFWRHPLCLCNQASVSALCTPTIWPQPFMAGCSKESKKKLLLIMTIHSQPDLVVDFVTHDNTSSVATVGSTLQGIFLSRYILWASFCIRGKIWERLSIQLCPTRQAKHLWRETPIAWPAQRPCPLYQRQN